MAKNIEIQINNGSNSYEVLYPKVDLTNNQGTSLPISSTSGNLTTSRISAGTFSGNYSFSSLPTCTLTATSTNQFTTKKYVDSKIVTISKGQYIGDGTYTTSKTMSILPGFVPDLLFIDGNSTNYAGFSFYCFQQMSTTPSFISYRTSTPVCDNGILVFNPSTTEPTQFYMYEHTNSNEDIILAVEFTFLTNGLVQWKKTINYHNGNLAGTSDSYGTKGQKCILNFKNTTYYWYAYKFVD